MRYQLEPASPALFEELLPLLTLHKDEVMPSTLPMDPDWDAYLGMEAAGALRIFTARTEFGVLAGYGTFIVRSHPHYKTYMHAVCDVFFLLKEFRGHFAGVGLLQFCHDHLQTEKVTAIYFSAPESVEPMLLRLGYKALEKNYIAYLEVK